MGYVEGVVIVQDTGILHPCEIVGNSVVSIPTTDDPDSLNKGKMFKYLVGHLFTYSCKVIVKLTSGTFRNVVTC